MQHDLMYIVTNLGYQLPFGMYYKTKTIITETEQTILLKNHGLKFAKSLDFHLC